MEAFKSLIVGSMATLAAYFSPIHSILFSVLYIFFCNLLFGLVAGMAINNESFSFKKAFACIKEVAVFYLIIASVFVVGEKMGNQTGAIQCISGITYAFIYFYACNILKNMAQLFPNSRIISFLYYCLTIEFIKKIPYLKDFQTLNPE